MRLLPVATFVLGLSGFASAALADTLKVPSDDFPTIQSAVDAVAEGDTILVAPGVYAESVNISGKTGIRLKGKAYPTIQPPGGDAITLAACTGVEVTGFEITGALMGVSVIGSTDVTLTKIVASSITGNAFNLGDSAGVLVSRCRVEGSAGNGVSDNSSTGVVVEKCSFTAVVDVAVYLSPYNLAGTGSDGAKVSKNRISETGTGMRLGGEDLVVEKNRLEVTGQGIYIDSSTSPSNAVISKNTVSTGGSDGIYVYGDGHDIVGNRLTGGGIYEAGYNHTLDRNTVTGGSYGIYANGSSTTVTRNTIRETTTGIVLNNYFFPVEGNRVYDTTGEGILVNTGGPGPIAGNKVSGAGTDGIRAIGSGNTYTGNRVTGSTNFGFYVTGTGNTFSLNKASGSGIFDLADTNAPAVNTYAEDNRFGTMQVPYAE